MPTPLLKDLNQAQIDAVTYTDGPSIILAGAGSGKTRVLTHKVAYLIAQKHIAAENILAVTFTNKAAQEMQERISSILAVEGLIAGKPTVATFHSLCARILRVYAPHVGLSASYTIYDSDDQEDVVREAMSFLDISPKEYKPTSILTVISQAKNELLDPSEFSQIARGDFQETAALVYRTYQRLLKEHNGVDFDDLLMLCVQLLTNFPDILKRYQEQFQYILIDEYQDTNHAQYKLAKLLAGEKRNLCVVGDFSQSIYSWRGADFTNLQKFQSDFKGCKVFELSQNYRSTQNILDIATTIIEKNTSHPILHLWTDQGKGEDVVIHECGNEQEEALYIARFVQKYSGEPSDIAVLYRMNAQSRVLEEAFLHLGIPYKLIGGTRFYERKEIKDIVSLLRVIANPQDAISLKRVEKLGKGRSKKFLDYVQSLDKQNLPETIIILDQSIATIGYLELFDEHNEDDRIRLENIKELRSVANQFPSITEFLENVSLVEQESMPGGNHNNADAVTFMTLHAAKGLEFPIVFMIGMEEGIFPHSRSLMDKREIEEERRLAYVGITRAQKKLFLTYARKRLFFGQRTTSIVSRFLMDILKMCIHEGHTVEYNEDRSDPDFF